MAWNASARATDIPSLLRMAPHISPSSSSFIEQMQKNYATMNQLYQRLGANSSRQDRQQLTKLRQDTKDLAASIKAAITADQSPKFTHDKYVSDFAKLMKDFMALSNDISKREQSMLEDLDRESKGYSLAPESMPANRRQTMQDYNASNWVEVETAIVQETNAELRAIERDLVDLNDMVRTVHTEVSTQGESLNQVETHTNSAAVDVEKGTKELSTAEKLANAIRKKKLIIGLLCLCICIVLALAIGVRFLLLFYYTYPTNSWTF